MKIEDAKYIGTHHYSYKSGEEGEIIGVKFVKPTDTDNYRPCFVVLFDDGEIDFCPIHDDGNYKLVKDE